MGEKRFKSKKYEEIGMRLIQTRPELAELYHSSAQIVFIESDKPKRSKGRVVYGECEKVSAKNQWAIGADFVVAIYTPNVNYMTEDQIEILILHELMHAGVKNDGDR